MSPPQAEQKPGALLQSVACSPPFLLPGPHSGGRSPWPSPPDTRAHLLPKRSSSAPRGPPGLLQRAPHPSRLSLLCLLLLSPARPPVPQATPVTCLCCPRTASPPGGAGALFCSGPWSPHPVSNRWQSLGKNGDEFRTGKAELTHTRLRNHSGGGEARSLAPPTGQPHRRPLCRPARPPLGPRGSWGLCPSRGSCPSSVCAL